jgi:hypothetical protein
MLAILYISPLLLFPIKLCAALIDISSPRWTGRLLL